VVHFAWNLDKNTWLIKERGISFERIVNLIEKDKVLDIIKHPNSALYPNQRIFILNIDNYAYLVPFVDDGAQVFLKTAIPSRKATKKYLRKIV